MCRSPRHIIGGAGMGDLHERKHARGVSTDRSPHRAGVTRPAAVCEAARHQHTKPWLLDGVTMTRGHAWHRWTGARHVERAKRWVTPGS